MRWKISQFIFCDQQQTLTMAQNTQQLEPMAVELLSYFCQNANKIISKDQLIESVWLGRIVSDNAVSKLVTKLRKAFADDVRKPQFIATFPKKGYKFIAQVEAILEQESSILNAEKPSGGNLEYKPTADTNTNRNLTTLPSISPARRLLFRPMFLLSALLILLIVLLISYLSLFQANSDANNAMQTHTIALVRDAGNDVFPRVSPDGSRVAYMSEKNKQLHLMIKNVVDERVVEIKHEDGVGVGPASWSADGTMLVYLVATPERCQYYIRSIENLTLGEPRLIHNCPAGSYGKIIFTHDNNRLVFSETNGPNTAYSLFEMDLSTEKKTRLTQPELFLGGNSQFDLHPTENNLLISSPDQQQWEGFYSLDLDSDTLTLMFKQDAYICCGIWSHDGNRVVLMGEHPAYQLISYDLHGKDMRIIYSGSRKLSRPARHTNGEDYLFTAARSNMDLNFLNIDNKQTFTVADTSADDRLATFSSHNEQVAYITLATGGEEVWLTDVKGDSRKKLTRFSDSRHYVDLQWSPNDNLLMALTLNEIHVIDAFDGGFTRLKISQTEIRGVSFKDNNTIAYSINVEGQWQVFYYQLDTHSVVPADTKWRYIQYANNAENTLWFDHQNNLYFGDPKMQVTSATLLKNSAINNRAFNLKKQGDQWLWYDFSDGRAIMRYLMKTDHTEELIQTNISHFDVFGSKVLYGTASQSNADIFQTKSMK